MMFFGVAAAAGILSMLGRISMLRNKIHLFVLTFITVCGPLITELLGQYDGRDPNAAWRSEAAAKIDQHRKADLAVTVKNPAGSLVEGANVSIKMQRHAFHFGSAVDPRYFLEDESNYNAGYAAKIEEIFNSAVMENHMKWRAWAGHWGSSFSQEVTQNGLDWLNNKQMATRGHTMMWPRYQSVSNDVRDLLDIENPSSEELQRLYDATFDHIADIGGAVAGKLASWDMLNEPRTSHDIEDKLIGFKPAGSATITSRTDLRKRWFKAAQGVDEHAAMNLNDYAILAGGDDLDNNIRNKYRQNLNQLVAAETPIDGLGFQAHFNETNRTLTSPVQIWAMLDEFQADYGLPVQITEFDYDTTEKELQADYTRDFMTSIFAHESVEAFVLWGFWEGKINKTDAALFDMDFNANLNGSAYLDLVFNQWWTDESSLTNSMGQYGTRGFLGDYEILVEYGGRSYEYRTSLGPAGLNFIATIPEPSFGWFFISLASLVNLRRTRKI